MEGTASVSMLNMCMSILGSLWFSARILWQISGGFRGQMGATATPLHYENSSLAPPFWQEERPYPDPHALFFRVSFSMQETYKLRRYSVEKPENFLEKRMKNFLAPSACSLSLIFLAHPLQVARAMIDPGEAFVGLIDTAQDVSGRFQTMMLRMLTLTFWKTLHFALRIYNLPLAFLISSLSPSVAS